MTTPEEISRLFAELDAKIKQFPVAFAGEFKQRVVNRTPVLTGALKAAWEVEMQPHGFTITNDRDYAGYIEYGTTYIAPRRMVGTTLLEKDQIADVALRKVGLK